MTLLLEFGVYGADAVPWSVPNVTASGRTYRTKKTVAHLGKLSFEDWQQSVKEAAVKAMDGMPPAVGSVMLSLTFFRETPPGYRHGQLWEVKVAKNENSKWTKRGKISADLVNLFKGTEDAAQDILYHNDVQVRSSRGLCLYGPMAGVQIAVHLIDTSDYPGHGAIVPSLIPPATRPRARKKKLRCSGKPHGSEGPAEKQA